MENDINCLYVECTSILIEENEEYFENFIILLNK